MSFDMDDLVTVARGVIAISFGVSTVRTWRKMRREGQNPWSHFGTGLLLLLALIVVVVGVIWLTINYDRFI